MSIAVTRRCRASLVLSPASFETAASPSRQHHQDYPQRPEVADDGGEAGAFQHRLAHHAEEMGEPQRQAEPLRPSGHGGEGEHGAGEQDGRKGEEAIRLHRPRLKCPPPHSGFCFQTMTITSITAQTRAMMPT